MNSKNVLGFVLATSLALTTLAGCKMPGGTGPVGGDTNVQQPGGQMNNGGQTGSNGQAAPAPAPAEARNGAAEALAEEREMGDMDAMAADETAARYTVFVVGGPEAGEGEVAITGVETEAETETKRDKIKTRIKAKIKTEVRAKIQERLQKRAMKAQERLKGNADKVKNAAKNAKWVDNGDGTESKSFSSDVTKTVNGKTMSRKVEIKRTRNIDGKDLVESYVKLESTLPNGMTRTSERTKKLNGEDGSYTVTYDSTLVFKNGTKRVVDWDKTIAADGTVTGSGTITWTGPDGKVSKEVKVSLNGTEEDTEATAGTVTVDADAPEAADAGTEPVEVTTEASGTATVGDDEDESEDESAESDEAATGDAAASA